jgi:hypothetical protein
MLDLGEPELKRARAGAARFRSCRLFLVGAAKEWGGKRRGSTCLIQSDSDVLQAFVDSPKGAVWVTRSTACLSPLARFGRPFSDRRLLILRSVQEVTHRVLSTWYRHVVVGNDGMTILETSELLDALAAPNREDLFIGAAYDASGKVVILYRGSLEPLVVPASWFKDGAGGGRIDLRQLSVIDYGQTISFGNQEIAAGAILYEFDEEYRRRARRNEIATDSSLGGSIRRLRLQKGFTQSDFDLPLKTVARIERGEVLRPQTATLRTIAKRLGVSVDALGSY